VNMMAVLLMVADAVNVVDVAIVIDDQNLRPILIAVARGPRKSHSVPIVVVTV
jgi:hypothetical protein